MPKRKFNYRHFFNNEEVDKTKFMIRLADYCLELCGNSDNPLLNVYFVDEKKLNRLYNQMRRTGHLYLYCGNKESESFQIKKERVVE